jgi:hypothetical protein
MTAGHPGDPVKGRYVTVALPRDALTAAMATASRPSQREVTRTTSNRTLLAVDDLSSR